MKNFVILLLIIGFGLSVAENTLANTLYGLYSDNSIKQTPATAAVRNSRAKNKRTPSNNKNTKQTEYNQTYMPDYSSRYQQKQRVGNTDELVKKGSKNYGQYGKAMQRTNPLTIDNPYNRLNNSYMPACQPAANTAALNSGGDAVKFKRGKDGNIYGYNKKGKKIGVYKVNNNGTTTLYDTQGNQMGTFK